MKEHRLVEKGNTPQVKRDELWCRSHILRMGKVHADTELRVTCLGRWGPHHERLGVTSSSSGRLQMVEFVGHHNPAHFTELIECGADLVRRCRGTMNPKHIAREAHHGRSCALAHASIPNGAFSDPDRIVHNHLEGAGSCHEGQHTLPGVFLSKVSVLLLSSDLFSRSTWRAQTRPAPEGDAAFPSWLGGTPNLRTYSRLNWLGLSYPTS